jgi:hypothetical protein
VSWRSCTDARGALDPAAAARALRRAGWKLGYTSAVMRAQMGITAPNFGPRVEPEIGRDQLALAGSRCQAGRQVMMLPLGAVRESRLAR